jgi:hypothetical protein
MTLQPQLIAPFTTGIDTDLESWIAPSDSFQEADNVHVRHGFVEKRGGFRVFGHIKKTNLAVNISNITKAANGVVTTASNHGLATNDLVYIAGVTGMTQVNNLIFTVTVTGLTTFQLNVNTSSYGAYIGGGTVGKIADDFDRIMGIYRFLEADGSKDTLVFSTTRANIYDGVIGDFIPLDSAPIMSGSDTDYVWSVNWQSTDVVNRLYFSNGKAWDGANLDGIRYFDGLSSGYITNGFRPSLGGGRTLYGAKLLFVLKQRLIAVGTYEFDGATLTYHPQRARWCQAQGPSNWNDLVAGGGGFVDAPTGDQSVSGRALSDQIINFFTNSVWTLRPVSDPALPFRWDKINDFRACDGKMASIGYDRYVVALGIRGITATDGVETRRIDHRIEEFVSDEVNVDAFTKVFCERSYANLRWWTLYPPVENTENQGALIYDDESAAFTTYSISLNSLGYGNFSEDFSLEDFDVENDLDITLEEAGEDTLLDYYWQDNQETLLGGNITGDVYVLEIGASDNGTSITSTLGSASWNPFKDAGKEAQMSYIDIYVDTDEQTTATVEFFKDDMTDPYVTRTMDFLPNLNFVQNIQDISQSNPCNVNVANSGLQTGDAIYIYGVTGMNQINGGPYTVTVVDPNNVTLDGIDSSAFDAYTGAGGVYRRAFYKTKVWKRVFAGGIGYEHRIRLTSSGADRPFRIHAFKPYFKPRGRRTVGT